MVNVCLCNLSLTTESLGVLLKTAYGSATADGLLLSSPHMNIAYASNNTQSLGIGVFHNFWI